MNRSHQEEFVDFTSEGRSTCVDRSYATKSSEHSRISLGKHVDSHIPGMEAVIVTVSGYDSLTRTKLVKLIVHVGALNTGSLSNCNTHVVCWKSKGRKYELAKKLRKKIISHRWFEDCLKAGVLLPEEPYINKSGEDETPLSWDDSVVYLSHSKALRKADSTINLTESVSQPESSSSAWGTTSTREHGPSTYNCRSSDVDQSDTSWRVPAFPQAQEPHDYSHKALRLSDDGSQETAEPHANQVPVERRTGVSGSTWPSFTDQSNVIGYQTGREAHGSTPCFAEVGQQARQSCSPHIGHYGCREHEDYKADYAQIRLRRRKEVEAPPGGLSEKYRRLMKESPALTSSKLPYGDERAGSPGKAFSARCLGSPSSQHCTPSTVSAGLEFGNQRDNYLLDRIDNTDLLVGKAVVSTSPSKDIACVICHTETKPTTEGLLECGHRYCYPCIQKWADEATTKQSTCPLCKASFEFITIRELERSANEEICTQVLEERVVLVGKQIRQGQNIILSCPRTEGICVACESKDSPELLMTCSRCSQRCCHTFCLDPPLPPGSSWVCSRCLPMRSSYLSRETGMSRFST